MRVGFIILRLIQLQPRSLSGNASQMELEFHRIRHYCALFWSSYNMIYEPTPPHTYGGHFFLLRNNV
jgi:hypothetical protein